MSLGSRAAATAQAGEPLKGMVKEQSTNSGDRQAGIQRAGPAAASASHRRYERFAAFYDLFDLPFERGRYRPLRRLLFEGLGGRILDAGVGTGRNIPFYPEPAEVIGIDQSRAMLARARHRCVALGGSVELHEADVRRTGFPDRHFDAVVASFLFCVLDPSEQLPALRELGRICRPGGEIRMLEYVYSEDPVRRLIMRLWAPWVRFAYGAAFDRHTERYVSDAGLEVSDARFVYHDMIRLIVVRRPG